MLKSFQRSEVTLVDFVYATYPSYSFAIVIIRYETRRIQKSVDNCGSMSINVHIGSHL